MEISERVTRVEAVLPTLATKSDLAAMEVVMVRWVVGVALAIIAVIVGFGGVLVNVARQPAASQPIIITVPGGIAAEVKGQGSASATLSPPPAEPPAKK